MRRSWGDKSPDAVFAGPMLLLNPSAARRRASWRHVVGTAVCIVALGAGMLPAEAANVSGTPGSSWGVFKPCRTSPRDNCAAVYAMTSIGSRLYIGGDFTSLVDPSGRRGPLGYQNLAVLDARNGQPITSFRRHRFDRSVLALAASADHTRIFAGGSFTHLDGSGVGRVVALSAGGGTRLSFRGLANRTVRALRLVYGRLYVGGDFISFNGHRRYRIAAVSPATGAVDRRFIPVTGSANHRSSVRSITAGGSPSRRPRIYLAGHFDTVGGSRHASIGAVDGGTGRVDQTFNPRVDQQAGDGKQAGDQAVAVPAGSGRAQAGVLLAAAGSLNRAYRFDLYGRRVWRLVSNGDVQTVTYRGTSVYLGGHFTCVASCYDSNRANNVRRLHVAAVSYNSIGTARVDRSWSPGLGPRHAPYFYGVWNLRILGGDLWAGGVFRNVDTRGPTYRRPKLAVFRG